MITYNNRVRIAIDPNAWAFILATQINDYTQMNALDYLCKNLKINNLWTKFKALYPFIGGTEFTHKFNLKDSRDLDTAFRLIFYGGWTHNSNGITGNGSNSYANTKLNPSLVFPNYNSVAISLYCRTENNNNVIDMGAQDNGFFKLWFNLNGNIQHSIYTQTNLLTSNIYSSGFFISSRTTNNSLFIKRNLVTLSTDTVVSYYFTNLELYIGNGNFSGNPFAGYYTDRNYAFASISEGLSDSEANTFYNIIQNYQTMLNRQV